MSRKLKNIENWTNMRNAHCYKLRLIELLQHSTERSDDELCSDKCPHLYNCLTFVYRKSKNLSNEHWRFCAFFVRTLQLHSFETGPRNVAGGSSVQIQLRICQISVVLTIEITFFYEFEKLSREICSLVILWGLVN